MATLFISNGKYFVKTKDTSGKWHSKYIGKTKASGGGRKAKVLTKAQALKIKQHYDSLEFNDENDFVVRQMNIDVEKVLDLCLEKDFLKGKTKYQLSTQTKNTYTEHIKYMKFWFKKIGVKNLKYLKIEHVDGFIRDATGMKGKPMAQDTLRNLQRDLFRFLRWADDEGYWNKARYLKKVIRVPKVHREPRYLEIEELHKLFDSVNPFYKNAVQFMYYTGCRRSDIGFIRFEDFNHTNNKLTFTVNDGAKTKRTITLSVIAEAANLVELQRVINPGSQWVFTNTKGGRLTGQTIYNAIRKGFEKMGKKATSHILRHTFASQMASHGASLKAIQELLRHKHIDETMIYAHITEKAQAEALNLLPR